MRSCLRRVAFTARVSDQSECSWSLLKHGADRWDSNGIGDDVEVVAMTDAALPVDDIPPNVMAYPDRCAAM